MKDLAEQHFPGAAQIVDLHHARQHLWELARRLHPNEEMKQKAWIKTHQKRLLDKGKIEKLVSALRSIVSTNSEVVEKIRTEADYFERNAERPRCFLRLFPASDVVASVLRAISLHLLQHQV